MKTFWLCFVPLFVAVDAVGVLPAFLSMTEGLERTRVRRVVWQSVVTATVVALLFLLIGQGVFRLLGISVQDFMIAGGSLLFVHSLRDLFVTGETAREKMDPESLGVVPLGVPLISGPAVLTTLLLLLNEHGPVPAAAALVVNVALAGALFAAAEYVHRLLGKAGSRAASKLASLLLAAIAVMMIRKGIMQLIVQG